MLNELPIQQIGEIANQGSPALLHMVGRAFGLGQEERDALTRGAFPTWFWVATGCAVGIVAGVYAHKAWPGRIDKLLKAVK